MTHRTLAAIALCLFVGLAGVSLGAGAAGSTKKPERLTAPSLPQGDLKIKHFIRCIAKEEKDQAFQVTVRGQIGPGGTPLIVKGPDNAVILKKTIPEGRHELFTVDVPKDGKVGEYVIFVRTRDGKEHLVGDLTTLPKEVYVMAYWHQLNKPRFFLRALSDEPEVFEVEPHKGAGQIEDTEGKILAQTKKGEWIKAEVGPKGVWFTSRARYIHVKKPVILAIKPDRWFAPNKDKIALKP
jgi:hypothetical protein